MIEFNGSSYFDDRLFILHLCRGRVESGTDDTVNTVLFHEGDADDLIWCLATYRNSGGYPLVSLNHFDTKNDALKYISLIEPTVPLISFNGQPRNPPLAYEDYLKWKSRERLSDYDYSKAYLPGGENHRELVVQSKAQFMKNRQRVRLTLASSA
jgi:hypothetical protein